MNPRLLLSVALAVVLVAACGKAQESAAEALAEKAIEAGTGQKVDIQTEDGRRTVTVEGEHGTLQQTIGEDVPLPDDFPADVALPEAYTVVSVMKMGPAQSVVLRSEESMAALVEQVRTAQAARGWKESVSMQGPEGAMLGFEKDKRGMMVNFRSDMDGQTVMSLSLQDR